MSIYRAQRHGQHAMDVFSIAKMKIIFNISKYRCAYFNKKM